MPYVTYLHHYTRAYLMDTDHIVVVAVRTSMVVQYDRRVVVNESMKGKKMNQKYQQWGKEREGVEQLFDVLGFLYSWGSSHPVEAQAFALELREMMLRYLLTPQPDTIRLHVEIPLKVFHQYSECYTAPRCEDILISGMKETIAKHKNKHVD